MKKEKTGAGKFTNNTVEQLENLTRGHGKKYVSLDEGAALYSIGKNTFRQMAKDAKATYKINRRVLVN